MTHPRFLRSVRNAAAVLGLSVLVLTGCSANPPSTSADGPERTLLTIPREDMGTFVQNFNPFSPTVAPMTQQAIYESMLIYNPADGTTTPWLATEWEVAEDGKSIVFTLRDGVTWSDGEPLVGEDVVNTFDLQREILGGYDYLDTVTADGNTVTFTFTTPFSPALFEVGQQIIVPEHVWSAVEDPSRETNAVPVGTGPYTEVAQFQAQSFVLEKNPNYWQPEKQQIEGIRMLAFAGNDGANLAAVNGDVDWAPQFMPNIEETFISKDPENRDYWFPPTGAMINWQLNTAKAPFDDVDVRKALSMAVNREQVTSIGMTGYTEPADCTGLSGAYENWKSDEVLADCDWTEYNVDAANALLDEAGYAKGADGMRTMEDGSPFAFDISVGSASSDWLSVANVISQNLADVGITATVDAPDWATVVSGYELGEFDTGIVWSNAAPTPYQYFRGMMGTSTVEAVGEKTFENYHRYGSEEAEQLLTAFAASSDEAEQGDIVNQLQEVYSENAPAVPLFPGPEWGAYTDVNFEGWPTEENPYATLSVRAPTTVLLLTSLKPASAE